MEKTFQAKPINNSGNFISQVDIIIPFHGQYDCVTNLLSSLFKLTKTNYYKVILVDSGSTNQDFIRNIDNNSKKNSDKLKQENIIKTVRLEENKGYGFACHAGYKEGESPYVCFLNSDCLIEDSQWLKNLGETLLDLKKENVRMVAPITNNPVGGDIHQLGSKNSKENINVIVGEDSYLTLPCFMCHRQLFEKTGGFLKEYSYGGYEDQEFAHRLKYHGFKQAVCKNSFVHHIGEQTFKEIMRKDPNGAGKINHINRNLCIQDMKIFNNKHK